MFFSSFPLLSSCCNCSHERSFDTKAEPVVKPKCSPSDPFRYGKEARVRAYRITLRSLKADEYACTWLLVGDTSLTTLRSYVRRKPPRKPRRLPFLSTAPDRPASPFLPAYSERYRVTSDIIPLIMIS